MLGVIAELPSIIKSLKDQFEQNQQKLEDMKKSSIDPLWKENYNG